MFLSFFVLTVLNPIPQPAVFIRAEALKKIGAFSTELKYVMDYEYWLKLYEEFGAPIVAPEALSAFRIHANSKGTTGFEKQFTEEYKIASEHTQNSLALLLHQLHNRVIFWIYSRIK
jgi:hypothetical protein